MVGIGAARYMGTTCQRCDCPAYADRNPMCTAYMVDRNRNPIWRHHKPVSGVPCSDPAKPAKPDDDEVRGMIGG